MARSWLRVTQAERQDSGIYYCNVTNLAAAGVTIHVVNGRSWSLVDCMVAYNGNLVVEIIEIPEVTEKSEYRVTIMVSMSQQVSLGRNNAVVIRSFRPT